MANIEDGPLADFQRDAQKPPEDKRKAKKTKAPKPPKPPKPPRKSKPPKPPKPTKPPKPSKPPKARRVRGKSGHGRLKRVLFVCLAVIGTAAVLSGAGYLTARKWAMEFVEQYTQKEPSELPRAEVTGDELAAIEQRVAAFADAVKAGTRTEPLALSEQEVNALLHGSDAWDRFEGDAYLDMQGRDVTAKLSMPLDSAGWDMLKGRYLNGTAVVRVSFDEGQLSVMADDFSVKARELPEKWRGLVRTRNLAQSVNQDSELAEVLDRIESIRVKASALFITPKTPAPGQSGQPAGDDEAREAEEPAGQEAGTPDKEESESA